jgi:hypothetical protein
MCQFLFQSILLSSAGTFSDFYHAIVRLEPVVIFPILFAVLILLGLVACEIGARRDPVRRHQRHKKQSESHTVVRL